MEKTYAQIMEQIETLRREADAKREQEVRDVVARIKEAIAVYQLTPADLGFGSGNGTAGKRRGRPPGRKTAKRAAAKKAAKPAAYADKSGNTWSGRGPRPRWLKEALAGGKTLEEFATGKK